MSEWISVEDRLPERGKEVLARAFEVTCIAMLYGNHWFISGINKPFDFFKGYSLDAFA